MPARGLPPTELARVSSWCHELTPADLRDRARVECEVAPRHVTILECHAPWREDIGPEWTRTPVARLRYTQRSGTWALYWPDRNSQFHMYDIAPSPDVRDLLEEIERDPTGIFWG